MEGTGLPTFIIAISDFDASSEISKIRMRISEDCLAASTRDTGIFRLGVPTGGGKTLASLRFALHHAEKTGKHHIIYITPYLSITEQTVQVFRNVLGLGEDDNEVLLEHYSSVVPDKDDEKEQQRRLAAERWDKPIIVTTMVQFLETVMSAKATKLRKFHNMADSVIVFDEIQALPTNTINVFNEVVSFLSKILGSTILLCSATQPLLEQTDRNNLLLSDEPDLIDFNNDYAARLRRTNIVASSHELALDDFATEIYDKALENIGKIYNCRWVLERTKRDHALRVNSERIAEQSEKLRQALLNARDCTSIDELRGVEGLAAKDYFFAFDDLILRNKDDFFFQQRSRRPPLDRTNALMSFVYSILTSDCIAALQGVGLDPYVGFLHTGRPGRASLALDLVEEFRPAIADRFVLTLINTGAVKPSQFEIRENGGVFLSEGGRKTVLAAWQKRKQETITHPFFNEKIPWGLVPHAQALLLNRAIRGDLDAYPPFMWK